MASKWIWGFLAGTAAGTAVGKLAMTNSGKENREDIAQAVNKGAERRRKRSRISQGGPTG